VVERALGRSPDVFAGEYDVGTLSIPGATVEDAIPVPGSAAGFDPAVYAEALWFRPGGIVDIDPESVAPPGAEAYEVLPQWFGLAQLTATGALERRGSFFFGSFYIAHPIARFPAGLYGAHAVTFILGAGVPLPAGDPGHSCVISEESGLPIVDSPLCGLGME
jgi:hypothetical protein